MLLHCTRTECCCIAMYCTAVHRSASAVNVTVQLLDTTRADVQEVMLDSHILFRLYCTSDVVCEKLSGCMPCACALCLGMQQSVLGKILLSVYSFDSAGFRLPSINSCNIPVGFVMSIQIPPTGVATAIKLDQARRRGCLACTLSGLA